MTYDYRKLEGRIVEKCGTQKNFASAMNLSERSISLKLNNGIDFRQGEIINACGILGIPPDSIADFFFTPKVQS